MQNLTDISRVVAKTHGMTNVKALEVVRTVFDCVKKGLTELEAGGRNRVSIQGFGNFGVKATKPRTVRNIRTGETSEVEASIRITFKPAEELKTIVKSGEFELTVPEKSVEAAHEDAPKAAAAPAKKEKAAPSEPAEIDVDKIPDLGEL